MKGFDTYLFVHLPKTAGTSFRVAIENLFGAERVAYDYTPEARETNDFVVEHYYERKDLEELRAHLMSMRAVILGGHFAYRRYASILPPSRVITFLREPVARVVSEYHHFRRTKGLRDSLLEFASREMRRNLQSRMLQGAELEAMAFVGITEEYEQSLHRLCDRLNWPVPALVLNVNPNQETPGTGYALSDAETDRLRAWNAMDLDLYQKARRLFDAS
jgi:hypothetical protein